MIDAPTQPRNIAARLFAAEVARTTSADVSVYQQKIQELRNIISEFPFKTTESVQKLTEVVQAVRQIVNLEMQTAGMSWKLPAHVASLQAAQADLLDFHLNSEFQAKAEMVTQDATTETNFPIELARDVAKYLDKLGKLTQDTSYHILAAEVLKTATAEMDKKLTLKEKITPNHAYEAYFLAHFERLLQLDLSETTPVDPDEVMLYAHILTAQDEKDGQVQNWDRQAAIGWWLFEFGMRHAVPEAVGYGMLRVSAATKASGGAQTCMRYCAKRLVANLAEVCRGGDFQDISPEKQADITEKLALPKKET